MMGPAPTQVNAVILAAGVGRRLWPLTRDRPKSLIDLGDGRTLLGRQLEVFAQYDAVSAVTVVTGHLDHVIEAFVARRADPKVSTAYNPFYADAGPIGSIWAVRSLLERGDFLVCNGDTLFRRELLDALLTASGERCGIALGTSVQPEESHDDVRVEFDDQRRVSHVSKGLRGATGRSAGVLLVRGEDARRRALRSLDALVRDRENLATTTPWHTWVDHLADDAPGVAAAVVEDEAWSEVDLHPDLESLREQLSSKLD